MRLTILIIALALGTATEAHALRGTTTENYCQSVFRGQPEEPRLARAMRLSLREPKVDTEASCREWLVRVEAVIEEGLNETREIARARFSQLCRNFYNANPFLLETMPPKFKAALEDECPKAYEPAERAINPKGISDVRSGLQ